MNPVGEICEGAVTRSRRGLSTRFTTTAAASSAPVAGDPAGAGSRSAAAAPDSDPAAGQAASRAFAGRASCVSPLFRAETNNAAPWLPLPHYQTFTRHQISAAMPPPSRRAPPPLSVHGNNQEDRTVRKTLIALTATAGLIGLGTLGASAAPLAPAHAPAQASAVHQADWYLRPALRILASPALGRAARMAPPAKPVLWLQRRLLRQQPRLLRLPLI